MKKIIVSVLSVLMALFLFTGCKPADNNGSSSEAVEEYPLTVNEVLIKERPQRVVSLSPALTEIVYELGNGPQLVGCSKYCDWPEEVKDLPRVGTAGLPEIDEIIELDPDLIITQQELPDSDLQRLKLKGIDVLVLRGASDVDGFSDIYIALGTALGGNNSGKQNGIETGNRLMSKFRNVKVQVQSFAETLPATVCYIASENGDIATGDTLIGELLKMAGGINVADGGTNFEFKLEELKLANPEVIFCPKGLASKIKADERYKSLSAVKNKNVIEIDPVLLERQTSRMADAVRFMAEALYPEAFSEESGDVSSETSSDVSKEE